MAESSQKADDQKCMDSAHRHSCHASPLPARITLVHTCQTNGATDVTQTHTRLSSAPLTGIVTNGIRRRVYKDRFAVRRGQDVCARANDTTCCCKYRRLSQNARLTDVSRRGHCLCSEPGHRATTIGCAHLSPHRTDHDHTGKAYVTSVGRQVACRRETGTR